LLVHSLYQDDQDLANLEFEEQIKQVGGECMYCFGMFGLFLFLKSYISGYTLVEK
jgi:hypothetical protein